MPSSGDKHRVKKPVARADGQRRKARNTGPGFDRMSKIAEAFHKQYEEESKPVSEENSTKPANEATFSIGRGPIVQSGLSSQSSVNGTSRPSTGVPDQSGPSAEIHAIDFKDAPIDPEQLGAWVARRIIRLGKELGGGEIEQDNSVSRSHSSGVQDRGSKEGGHNASKERKHRQEQRTQTPVSRGKFYICYL